MTVISVKDMESFQHLLRRMLDTESFYRLSQRNGFLLGACLGLFTLFHGAQSFHKFFRMDPNRFRMDCLVKTLWNPNIVCSRPTLDLTGNTDFTAKMRLWREYG